jgi:hypothetical protein
MNIDITFEAEINRVTVHAKAKDGMVRRTCKLVLAREFDMLLCQGIKGDALKVLRSLNERGLAEATLPIDGIVANGTFKAALSPYAEVTISEMHGVVAKAKACKPGKDEPPTIKLTFEFDWSESAWVFLGRNCLAHAEVTIRSSQLELELPKGPGKGKNGPRPRAGA